MAVTDVASQDAEGVRMPFAILVRVGDGLTLTNPDVLRAEEQSGRLRVADEGYRRCREGLANRAIQLISQGQGICSTPAQRACAGDLRAAQWRDATSRSEQALRRIVFQNSNCQ